VIPFQILKQFKSPYTEVVLPFQPLFFFFFPLWREVESPKNAIEWAASDQNINESVWYLMKRNSVSLNLLC